MGGNNSSFNVDHAYDDEMKAARKSPMGDDDSISTISGGAIVPGSDEYLALLETPEITKKRKRSHWVAHATMVIMTTGFSIILSGTWPYLVELAGGEDNIDKTALGWVIAANPFGQMIASPIVGYIGNRMGRIREVCYFTVACSIAANALYGLLPYLDDVWENSYYHLMILSRFVVGLSSANVSLSRAYIAGATTESERTKGIAMVSAAQALGLVIGPAIQAVLSLIIDDPMWKYASVGWVMVVLGFVNLIILTPCIFTEYNIAEKEREYLNKLNPEKDTKLPKPDYVPLVGILFAFFMVQFVYVLLETLMEPFVEDQYGLCADIAVVLVGIAFSLAGVLCIAMFFTAAKLATRFDERLLLIFGAFVPLIIGTFLFLPWGDDMLTWCSGVSSSTMMSSSTTSRTTMIMNETWLTAEDPLGIALLDKLHKHPDGELSVDVLHPLIAHRSRRSAEESGYASSKSWDDLVDDVCGEDECLGCPPEQDWCDGYPRLNIYQFMFGYLFVFIGFPFGVSMANTIFSKILGPRPQGTWMGILTAAGSLARIIGPIFVSYIYTKVGTRANFTFILVGMILGLIDIVVLYKRLVPLKIPDVYEEEEKEKY